MRRLAILTFVLPLSFGSAVVVSTQTPAPPSAAIVGRVVDAQTRSPIAGVVVGLTGGPAPTPGTPPTQMRVMTDADGRYAFRGLSAGAYQITATVGGLNNYAPNGFVVTGMGFPIGGYLNGGFGQQRPDGPLQPIDLADETAARRCGRSDCGNPRRSAVASRTKLASRSWDRSSASCPSARTVAC